MKIQNKIVVVTGGADGIGRALCERFHREGARAVIVADLNGDKAEAVAQSIGGVAFQYDVANESDIVGVVEETEKNTGPIDLFRSNAGVFDGGASPDDVGAASNDSWTRSWNVHVMAHVYAARALLPRMIARGGGYFLNTSSAAGLLSQIGNAVYATTKHAAVGFVEILAITHRDQGIGVSVFCPQRRRYAAASGGRVRPATSRWRAQRRSLCPMRSSRGSRPSVFSFCRTLRSPTTCGTRARITSARSGEWRS